MLPESNDTPYTQCEFEPWQLSGDAFVDEAKDILVNSGADLDFDGTTLVREMLDSPDALTWATAKRTRCPSTRATLCRTRSCG